MRRSKVKALLEDIERESIVREKWPGRLYVDVLVRASAYPFYMQAVKLGLDVTVFHKSLIINYNPEMLYY